MYNARSSSIKAGVQVADSGTVPWFLGWAAVRGRVKADRRVPKNLMVLDNAASLHACGRKESLKLHPELELFAVPPYSPYLIAVERAWWYVRRKITHGIYVKQLKQRKPHFW